MNWTKTDEAIGSSASSVATAMVLGDKPIFQPLYKTLLSYYDNKLYFNILGGFFSHQFVTLITKRT